jgi:hypothetical protein
MNEKKCLYCGAIDDLERYGSFYLCKRGICHMKFLITYTNSLSKKELKDFIEYSKDENLAIGKIEKNLHSKN